MLNDNSYKTAIIVTMKTTYGFPSQTVYKIVQESCVKFGCVEEQRRR